MVVGGGTGSDAARTRNHCPGALSSEFLVDAITWGPGGPPAGAHVERCDPPAAIEEGGGDGGIASRKRTTDGRPTTTVTSPATKAMPQGAPTTKAAAKPAPSTAAPGR